MKVRTTGLSCPSYFPFMDYTKGQRLRIAWLDLRVVQVEQGGYTLESDSGIRYTLSSQGHLSRFEPPVNIANYFPCAHI